MNKNVFEAPEIEVLKFTVDVITTSDLDNWEEDIFPTLPKND